MEPGSSVSSHEVSSSPLTRLLLLLSLLTTRTLSHLSRIHTRTPYLRSLPLPALLVVLLIACINLPIWAISALILRTHPALISTAALAYSLGLRHALDADHISAIDLMTRRLIASGQRPVTVGTWFSLGHSTIVIITSIIVAATAAGVRSRFGSFSTIGGIIGSAISASFLILLGIMNVYILYRLVIQMRKILAMSAHVAEVEGWKIEGGGVLFRVLKRLFRIVDRPWKMYPIGVMFGLGFDTSSEVALLGISSIQAAKGTSIWLIMIFPILFTAGMCLIDTIDGALMLSLYVAPMERYGAKTTEDAGGNVNDINNNNAGGSQKAKDPIAFLYYSIVLTTLTVLVALTIGMIQLLTLVQNVANPSGAFWDGIVAANDYYEVIGGSICASFVVVGIVSVICYKPWRRRVERNRPRVEEHGEVLVDVDEGIEGMDVEGGKGGDEYAHTGAGKLVGRGTDAGKRQTQTHMREPDRDLEMDDRIEEHI